MLYVIPVLSYVLCQRKTSQRIRTIDNIFQEKHDDLLIVCSFFEFEYFISFCLSFFIQAKHQAHTFKQETLQKHYIK